MVSIKYPVNFSSGSMPACPSTEARSKHQGIILTQFCSAPTDCQASCSALREEHRSKWATRNHCPSKPHSLIKEAYHTKVHIPAPSAPQASHSSLKKFLFSLSISHSCSTQSASTYINLPAFFQIVFPS